MGMRPPIFRGTVKNGRIVLDNPAGFKAYGANLEGHRVEVVLRKRNVERSEQQNKYYHGVVVTMLADHLGYTKDEMHDTLKKKFKVKTTTHLKVDEFKEYVDSIVRWSATELGFSIPDPSEVDY